MVPHCVCCRISSMWTCLCSFISLLLKRAGRFPGLSLCLHFCTRFFSSLQDDNRLRFLIFFSDVEDTLNPLYVFRPTQGFKPYFSLSDLSFHTDSWSWIHEVSVYITPKWQAMLPNLGYWLTQWKINHSHKLFELTSSVSAKGHTEAP